jgi:hypothetical protein
LTDCRTVENILGLQRRKKERKKETKKGASQIPRSIWTTVPSFSEVSPKVRVGFTGVLSPGFTNRNIHEIYSG